MSYGKDCPLMVSGGNMSISGKCIGKNCAWYNEQKEKCILQIIADKAIKEEEGSHESVRI